MNGGHDVMTNVMTNEQYYGIIKMISAIVRHCETKEEIRDELDNLLRDADKTRENNN